MRPTDSVGRLVAKLLRRAIGASLVLVALVAGLSLTHARASREQVAGLCADILAALAWREGLSRQVVRLGDLELEKAHTEARPHGGSSALVR